MKRKGAQGSVGGYRLAQANTQERSVREWIRLKGMHSAPSALFNNTQCAPARSDCPPAHCPKLRPSRGKLRPRMPDTFANRCWDLLIDCRLRNTSLPSQYQYVMSTWFVKKHHSASQSQGTKPNWIPDPTTPRIKKLGFLDFFFFHVSNFGSTMEMKDQGKWDTAKRRSQRTAPGIEKKCT